MLFSKSVSRNLIATSEKVDKSLQLISGKRMAEYCLLALSLIIIEGFRANKAYMGNPTLQTLHFREQILELKLFLTYFS